MSTGGYWFLIMGRTLFATFFSPPTLLYCTPVTWAGVLCLSKQNLLLPTSRRGASRLVYSSIRGRFWPLHSHAFCFHCSGTNSSKCQRCSQIKLLEPTRTSPVFSSGCLYQVTPVHAPLAGAHPSRGAHCQQVPRVLNACWLDRCDHRALTWLPSCFCLRQT